MANRWTTEGSEEEAEEEGTTLNGDVIEPGGSFSEAVNAAARESGYRNFRVLLDDVEVGVDNAPAIVPVGAHIQVMPYDKAGS